MLRTAAVVVGLSAALAASVAAGEDSGPATRRLRRHLPVLVLHPAERYPPVGVDAFLAASDARPPRGRDVQPRRGGRDTDAARRPRLYARRSARDRGLLRRPRRDRRPCTAPSTGGGASSQYWLFEPLNLWSPVVPPAANAWQAHEGDWEHVAIVLDAGGAPVTAGYAQHCGGVRIPWARVPLQRGTRRPIVYVGLGSHASYPSRACTRPIPRAGPIRRSSCRSSTRSATRWSTTPAAAGASPRHASFASPRRAPLWTSFAGTWGEARCVRLGDVTFADGAGPIGPTHKAAWRNPVGTVASWPLAR